MRGTRDVDASAYRFVSAAICRIRRHGSSARLVRAVSNLAAAGHLFFPTTSYGLSALKASSISVAGSFAAEYGIFEALHVLLIALLTSKLLELELLDLLAVRAVHLSLYHAMACVLYSHYAPFITVSSHRSL